MRVGALRKGLRSVRCSAIYTCVGSCSAGRQLGHEKRLKAYIINYADDLVICCRGRAEEALAAMRSIMSRLKLTVNETKTRVCQLPEEKFDFLGYTFGRCYSPKTGRAYWGTIRPRNECSVFVRRSAR